MRRRVMRLPAAALALAAAFCASPALSEVSVSGDASDLTVEADGAELAEVIEAVGEAVGSPIEPPVGLPATTVTGVYQGSVSEVLKALVPWADFVVAWRDGRASVRFIDGNDPTPTAEATPASDGADDEPDAAEADDPQSGEPGGEEPPTPARKVY